MFFEFDVFLGVNTDLILNNFLRIDVVLCSIGFKENFFCLFREKQLHALTTQIVEAMS